MRKPAATPFKDKQRVTIFMTEEKELELRKKALEAGVSLSTYLSAAGSITPSNTVKENKSFADAVGGQQAK